MGANGCVYVNGTGATTNGTDGFTAIQFTEDSVLGAITGKMDDSADLISDATVFSQGQVIYCPATSVTLASGGALLYKA
tara:strand:+ start:285 stop:521 length:237 start_codon:yes stop_codon:yes gene_type:complete